MDNYKDFIIKLDYPKIIKILILKNKKLFMETLDKYKNLVENYVSNTNTINNLLEHVKSEYKKAKNKLEELEELNKTESESNVTINKIKILKLFF